MSNVKVQDTEIFITALKAAMAKYGLNQPQLAEKIGLSSGGVSSYLSGKTDPGFTNIQKIATGLGLTVAEFFALGENGNPDDDPESLSADEMAERGFISVPFSDNMKLAAGGGGRIPVTDDEETSKVIVHGPSLGRRSAKNLQAFRVGGDSMEPLIAEGGIVLADTSRNDLRNLQEGGIYVLCWELDDGECAVKRLRWAEKGRMLSIESAEPFYQPVFKRPAEVVLIGLVIWSWRKH